jgi:hypothetical protein
MINIDLKTHNYNKNLDKPLKQQIISSFEKEGIIKFENLKEDFIDFIKQFTSNFANDANRREERMCNKKIRNVDIGKQKIFLHSETSFSPSQPEIVWFYCIHPPKTNSGYTTYCDGMKLWEKLPANLKVFFLENPILYKLKIPVNLKIKKDPKTPKRKWYLEAPGVKNCFLDYSDLTMNLDYFKFAIEKSRFHNKLCFANHLLIPLDSEPQILKRSFLNQKNISKRNFELIENLAEANTKTISWKQNDLIMIDNYRFMHGRTEISKEENERDIVVVQSTRSNFRLG